MRVAPVCDWFLTYTACRAAALARGGAEVTSLCRDHSWEVAAEHSLRVYREAVAARRSSR